MYTNRVARILALFAAGTLFGGIAGCQSDSDFREERKENAVRDFREAKTKEFLSGTILSLEECINFALSHNLKLKAASLEKEAFERMRLAEGLGIFPKMELSGRIAGGRAVSGKFNRSSQISGFTGNLEHEFNYTLLDACMAAFQTRQAHDRLLLREKRMERLKQNIVLEVSKLYYHVAALQKYIKELQTFRGELSKYKKEAAPFFRLEMIELEQLLAFAAMEETLESYIKEYESAKSRLRMYLGMYPNGDIKVNDTLLASVPALPAKVLLHELEQVALMQRPELFVTDIRTNLDRTQYYKAFFQLWPTLRIYQGLQAGTASDSWENLAWTASNLLKTPEIILQTKSSLQAEELEKLRASLQGLAVLAQLRMAEASFKSSSRTYNNLLRESQVLASAVKVRKGQKKPADILKAAIGHRKVMEAASKRIANARKAADRIKNPAARDKALKKVDADWRKVLIANAGKLRVLRRNLTGALTSEKVRMASRLASVRKDLALAGVHASFGTIFNALGFDAVDNAALEGSIEQLKKKNDDNVKGAVEEIRKEFAARQKRQDEAKKARALYEKGALAYIANEHIKSVEYLKRAAERGNAEALFGLGKLYWNGQGVPRDYRMAVGCYTRAADYGKLEAMLLAGWLYYSGGIVEKDLLLARKYYKMAADRNDERAFYWLGMIYFELKAYKQALSYFKYAARGGDPAAMTWVGTIYRNGLAENKADLEKAIFWYKRGAEKGDVNAMNSLYMIYLGAFDGEKKDPEKAVEWREKYEAALRGK